MSQNNYKETYQDLSELINYINNRYEELYGLYNYLLNDEYILNSKEHSENINEIKMKLNIISDEVINNDLYNSIANFYIRDEIIRINNIIEDQEQDGYRFEEVRSKMKKLKAFDLILNETGTLHNLMAKLVENKYIATLYTVEEELIELKKIYLEDEDIAEIYNQYKLN